MRRECLKSIELTKINFSELNINFVENQLGVISKSLAPVIYNSTLQEVARLVISSFWGYFFTSDSVDRQGW